jgi:hypothetical protein
MRICGREEDTGKPAFPEGRQEGHGDFVHALAGAWWRARSSVDQENRVQWEDAENLQKMPIPIPAENPWGNYGQHLWSANRN